MFPTFWWGGFYHVKNEGCLLEVFIRRLFNRTLSIYTTKILLKTALTSYFFWASLILQVGWLLSAWSAVLSLSLSLQVGMKINCTSHYHLRFKLQKTSSSLCSNLCKSPSQNRFSCLSFINGKLSLSFYKRSNPEC